MSTVYETAIAFILRVEGPLSDDSEDNGGETKWGVARRAHPEITDEQWANWTVEDSAAMFWRRYWVPIRGDELPGPIALAVFDAAVNQGLHAAVTMLQEELHVTVDGHLGPKTLEAIRHRHADDLARAYCARRGFRYAYNRDEFNPDFVRFGRGWMGRLLDCYGTGLVAL
jgi:lysozyme family protein